MSYNNPGNISSSGSPQSVATPAVGVTASSSGQIIGPSGYTWGWALVSNASPWVMTLATAEGTKTLLPYEEDICIPTSAGMSYFMAPAPIVGAAAAPANSITCYQIDWYVAGGAPPPGIFPVSLTAAALIGSLELGSAFVAISDHSATGAALYNDTLTLAGTEQSVLLQWSCSTTVQVTNVQVTGNTSGYQYFEGQPWIASPATPYPGFYRLWVPISGAADAAGGINIQWTITGASGNVPLIGVTSSQPPGDRTNPYPYGGAVPFNETIGHGATLQVTPAPPAGQVYVLSNITISPNLAANTTLVLQGVASGTPYAQSYGGLAGTAGVQAFPTAGVPATEALEVVVGAVAGGGSCTFSGSYVPQGTQNLI